MLQRLPIALEQVKAGNISKNSLNEIRQIIYSLYREKGITKKVYNNIMNSIRLQNRMDTLFMNSQNNKTSDRHRSLFNLSDKINLKISDKYVCFFKSQHLLYIEKYKKSYENNKFKISTPTWNEEFEFPDGSYFASDIQNYFKHILKKYETVTDYPSI